MPFRDDDQDLFEESRMSFGEHLEELRVVLIRSLIGVAVGCIFGFIFALDVVSILQQPLERALTKFYVDDAKQQLRQEHGYLAPEWLERLEENQAIPDKVQIDPRELLSALQDFDPQFMQGASFNQSLFNRRDFEPWQVVEICKSWVNLPAEDQVSKDQLSYLWNQLGAEDQNSIRVISQKEQQAIAADDVDRFVTIMNSLLSEPEMHKQPAFADLIRGSEKSWLDSLKKTGPSELEQMKSKLEASDALNMPDAELLARMNRALLSRSLISMDRANAGSNIELTELTIWRPAKFQAQSLGATDPFMIFLKAGLVTGLLFASPWVFYQLWSFVAAGLYPSEQKYIYFFLPASLLLFFSGVLLAFFFVFDPVLDFLFSFNAKMGIAPQPRINDWLSFVMFLPLGFGIAFQLPLVMMFINRIELVSVEAFVTKWRIAVVAIFGLSMVLTPADPVSMVMLAVPLSGLYFLGILLCKWLNKPANPFQVAN